MTRWIQRYYSRQLELQAGVDADLVRANRRRERIGTVLMVAPLLLMLALTKVHPKSMLYDIMGWIAGLCFLAGIIVLGWARQERAWLDRPDPEKPPTLFPK